MSEKLTYGELEQRVRELEKAESERKKVEEALRESKEQYRDLVEKSGLAIFVVNAEGRIVFFNRQVCELSGYEPGELEGRLFTNWVHPEDRERVLDYHHRRLAGDSTVPEWYESRGLCKDGSIRHVEVGVAPIVKEGHVVGSRVYLHDITEQKKTREELEKSRQDFQHTLESLNEVVVRIDADFVIKANNRASSEIMGIPQDQFVGRRCYELFYGRDTVCPECPAKKAMETKQKASALRYRPDGVILERTLYPILGEEGRVNGATILALDITKRKQAEEALRESEESYRLLADNVSDVIWTMDMEQRLKYVSPSVQKVLGYTPHEVMELSLEEILTSESYEKAVATFVEEVVRDGEPGVAPDRSRILELEQIRKDGSIIWTEVTTSFLRDEGGSPNGIIGITRDITERKELQEQLSQAQKMEAIGTLAGGIAHNFNNILMGIQGRVSLMMIDKDPSHPDYEYLKGIEDYVRNAVELTKDLLGFARSGKYEVKPTDLNALIKHKTRMFGRTKKEIQIHEKYEKDLWTVEVDRGQIQQALLNLYVNAWQAMPGGGDLYIQTENVTLDEAYVKPFEIAPGRYAKISVTDMGIGMDDATLQKIFDPFFSTKSVGQGSGLGLASVYGIVKNHGGFINVYSEKGEGTTFNIYLPASERELVEEGRRPGRHKIQYGQGRVLLVDDEDMIIDVGQEMLETLGYRVLIARSGKEALDVYKKQKEVIDLVILDMIMPGMGGGETYDRMKEIDESVRVLLSSGYSINGQAKEIMDRGCTGFIQKPFSLNDLSIKIREALGETKH